ESRGWTYQMTCRDQVSLRANAYSRRNIFQRLTFVKEFVRRVACARLTTFFEPASHRPLFTVIDVVNSPTAAAVNHHEDDRFLLTKILERHWDLRFVSVNCRFPDRELLNLHVLRGIQRVAIDRADFAF